VGPRQQIFKDICNGRAKITFPVCFMSATDGAEWLASRVSCLAPGRVPQYSLDRGVYNEYVCNVLMSSIY
jgi:hypothetical protein